MVHYVSKHKGQTSSIENPGFGPKQWIQVVNPTDEEIEQLAAELSIDASVIKDTKDLDEMPRFESDENSHYLFFRYAYRTHGSQVQTAPVLFIVTDGTFISVSIKHFDALEEMLDKYPHLTTNSPRHLLMPAAGVCLKSYDNQLNGIGSQIKNSRNSLRDEKFSNKHFVKFVEIEDVLNDFSSELVPINKILMHLAAGHKSLKFSETDRNVIDDLQLETAQLIDESNSYLKTIVNIREAYSNIMTNNLNRQIKILTTLTIVLTVPTIVGSFFGMNVPIPFANSSSAFVAIFLITMAVSLAILAYLKHKKWL